MREKPISIVIFLVAKMNLNSLKKGLSLISHLARMVGAEGEGNHHREIKHYCVLFQARSWGSVDSITPASPGASPCGRNILLLLTCRYMNVFISSSC